MSAYLLARVQRSYELHVGVEKCGGKGCSANLYTTRIPLFWLHETTSFRYTPATLATAGMFFAARQQDMDLPEDNPPWWASFSVPTEDLISVCHLWPLAAPHRRTRVDRHNARSRVSHKWPLQLIVVLLTANLQVITEMGRLYQGEIVPTYHPVAKREKPEPVKEAPKPVEATPTKDKDEDRGRDKERSGKRRHRSRSASSSGSDHKRKRRRPSRDRREKDRGDRDRDRRRRRSSSRDREDRRDRNRGRDDQRDRRGSGHRHR